MSETREETPFVITVSDDGLSCEVGVRAGFDPESTGQALCLGALREHGVKINEEVETRVGALINLHALDNDAGAIAVTEREVQHFARADTAAPIRFAIASSPVTLDPRFATDATSSPM